MYENAPPLQVRASARRLSVNATALREQFTATVTDAAGQAPSPADLSWSWSFGDTTGSGQAAPTHAFPPGRWFVTVVVSDRANGTGGTDTIPVSVDSHALGGTSDRGGAGRSRYEPVAVGRREGRRHHAVRAGQSHARHSSSATPAANPAAGQSTGAAASPAATPHAGHTRARGDTDDRHPDRGHPDRDHAAPRPRARPATVRPAGPAPAARAGSRARSRPLPAGSSVDC